MRRHRRLPWTVFWTVAVVALGAGVVTALVSGHPRYVVAIVTVGLCVVGVGAGFLASSSWGPDGRRDQPFASKDGFNSGGWGAL
jgi:hypothetical protein